MLLICYAKVSVNCKRVRVAHSTSAHPVKAICPACAAQLIRNRQVSYSPADTLERILKGEENARERS